MMTLAGVYTVRIPYLPRINQGDRAIQGRPPGLLIRDDPAPALRDY